MTLPTASVGTDWLTAVGTVGAVLVALFLSLAIPYWRRPKLEIPRGTQPELTEDTSNDGIAGDWWDIPVRNAGRRDSAVGAQVILTNVRVESPNPTRVPLRSLKWTHLDSGTAEIPAGITRSVELGQFWPKGTGPFKLEIYPPMKDSKRNELQRGTYHFDLAVVARNARARYYRLDVVVGDGSLSFGNGIVKAAKPKAKQRASTAVT